MADLQDLKRAAPAFVKRSDEANLIRARLGKPEADGTVTVDVPNRPHHVYVEIEQGQAKTVSVALANNSPRTTLLPVWLRQQPNGELVVWGTDWARAQTFMGAAGTPASTGRHSHAIGSGLDDPVEARRILPGLAHVYTLGGLDVFVEPFWYEFLGAMRYWPGDVASMNSHVPGSANQHRLAGIFVNPRRQIIETFSGDVYPLTVPLSPTMIADITPDKTLLPIAAVRLQNGQTTINDDRDLLDCRLFFRVLGDTSIRYDKIRSIGPSFGAFEYVVYDDQVVLVTVTQNEDLYLYDPGDFSPDMPSKVITIKRVDDTPYHLTITPDSGTIDGEASQVLDAREAMKLIADGANWHII